MRQHKQLLLANRAWAAELTDENADFFSRQVAGQRPQFLWIGCSDSRVSPEQKTQSLPGLMFIHRNIANLVHADDLNLLSVLQYAVDVLEVPNIVICGHHGCGGIKAALAGGVTGPVDTWLEAARAVKHAHADELAPLDDAQKVDRLVEMNVRDQLINLAHTETVRTAFAAGRDLTLHGWVYDIRDGLLKPLMEIDRHTRLDEVGRPEPVLV
ncbi:carbonic anhydrase [Sphingomonas sp. KR1UV-12]|uniref:Carbonic anhydrase n=1 Tax=Sphingomonas aurea TaxID=3063994 RepID=A0ABT9EGX3_9SPHN|nr:carbonic anhydrase [Sphingomonas sp. KR1UV-12]MDP1026026.1 carbonic anhydrase [Sphingomonas sp. KR1UV-12]